MRCPNGHGSSVKSTQSSVEACSSEDDGRPRRESRMLLLMPALGANPEVMQHEATEAISRLHMAFLSYLRSYLLCFIIKVGWMLHSTSGLYQGSQ